MQLPEGLENTPFNNKKCVPKLIFFNEKKIEKGSDDFLVQN